MPRFNAAFRARLSAWVPAGPRHRGDHHLDLVAVAVEHPGDGVGDDLHHPVGGLLGPPGGHDHDLVGGVGDGRQLPGPHRDGQPGDGATLVLPVQLGQLGDRQGAAVDQVAQHPTGADRGAAGPGRRRSPGARRRRSPRSRRRRVRRRAWRSRRRRSSWPRSGGRRPDRRRRAIEPLSGGRASSSRCTVVAALPASSSSRLAARPVGAASAIEASTSVHSLTIASTVRLLPVPGPPVSAGSRRAWRPARPPRPARRPGR